MKMTKTLGVIAVGGLVASLLGLSSCASVVPASSADHQAMSKIIQSKYAYAEVLGPIFIKRRGDEAAAYYGVNMAMAQQADEFKSEFLLRAGRWELKSTKSVKPWYRRWK